jgi:hypothetical protein
MPFLSQLVPFPNGMPSLNDDEEVLMKIKLFEVV